MIPLAIPTSSPPLPSDNCGSQCPSNIYFHHFQHRSRNHRHFSQLLLPEVRLDLRHSRPSFFSLSPAPMLSGQSLTASSPSVSFGENGGQIRVCVDKRSGSDTGAISESNEVNNCSPWTTVTTTTTPPPYDPTRYPDLVASATAPTTAVAMSLKHILPSFPTSEP